MILVITEANAWENERWAYVLDMEKQDGETINNFMIFMRLANDLFDKAAKEAKKQPPALGYHPLFNRHPQNPFAASKYTIKFYNSIDTTLGRVRLSQSLSPGTMVMSESSGYQNATNLMLDRKISPRKMQQALAKIRDKKENDIYKSFENILYAVKQPA